MQVRVLATAVVLVAAALAAGPAARQQAVFRAEATYVEVAVTVFNRNGGFVDGLTAADFEIKEDHLRQTVAVLSQVDLPTRWRQATPAEASRPVYRPELPRDLQVADGRVYLIYLNAVEARYVPVTRRIAKDFVQSYLMPEDVVALWSPSRGLVSFTNDRPALARAIDNFLGTEVDEELGVFDRGPLPPIHPRLTSAMAWFSSVQGRRKSILLFSAGWQGLGPSFSDSQPPSYQTALVDRPDVQIYAVDVRGLVAPFSGASANPTRVSDSQSAAAATNAELDALSSSVMQMKWLAEDSGGFAIVNHNTYQESFRRIVEENSRYYVLGYQTTRPAKTRWDFRSITVKVIKPGLKNLTVRSRRGYIAR